jgi:hypothetical protein
MMLSFEPLKTGRAEKKPHGNSVFKITYRLSPSHSFENLVNSDSMMYWVELLTRKELEVLIFKLKR